MTELGGNTLSMNERPYISWSEISSWLHCQLLWKWRYVNHLRGIGKAGSRLQMGSAAHLLLEAHFGVSPATRTLPRLLKACDKAFASLDLDETNLDKRLDQLHGYANTIWNAWGKDKAFPRFVVETPIEVPVPWSSNKGFRCIPDAYHVDFQGRVGTILTHKTALSSMPTASTYIAFHPQARMEAWALRGLYNLKEVRIYVITMTPKAVEREGPYIIDDATNARTEEELHSMFDQVGAVPVIARPGNHCWECQFRELHEAISLGADFIVAAEPYTRG